MAGGGSGTGPGGRNDGSVVDETVLAELVAGLGPGPAGEVCELLLADARRAVASVRAALESADAGSAARCAHRMKSAGGFVGVTVVTALWTEIEQLAEQDRLDEIAARLELLSEELELASVELTALLSRLSAAPVAAGASSTGLEGT